MPHFLNPWAAQSSKTYVEQCERAAKSHILLIPSTVWYSTLIISNAGFNLFFPADGENCHHKVLVLIHELAAHFVRCGIFSAAVGNDNAPQTCRLLIIHCDVSSGKLVIRHPASQHPATAVRSCEGPGSAPLAREKV